MPRIGDDEMKRLVKEAIREWMDAQFAAFGRWSFYGILTAALGALAYFGLKMNGWHR